MNLKNSLAIFVLTLFLHLVFISTKSYSANAKHYGDELIISNVSEGDYLSFLYSNDDPDWRSTVINSLKVKYIFGLPSNSILAIYGLYFIAICIALVSFLKSNRLTHDTKTMAETA